jgi:hypothetical protein
MCQPAKTDGRKRGPPNRKTTQKIAQIEASGLTPLDYMLAVKRDPRAKAARRDEMARSAAPYIHPPIAPIDLDVARRIGRLLNEIFEKLKS